MCASDFVCVFVFVSRGSTATQTKWHLIPWSLRQKRKIRVCCHGNSKSLHGEKCGGAVKLPLGWGSDERGGGKGNL